MQVVHERDAVSVPHGPDVVVTIGKERDPLLEATARGDGDGLAAVANAQPTAAVRRAKLDDERAKQVALVRLAALAALHVEYEARENGGGEGLKEWGH